MVDSIDVEEVGTTTERGGVKRSTEVDEFEKKQLMRWDIDNRRDLVGDTVNSCNSGR